MLHHRTTDLEERAHHIAMKAADDASRAIENYDPWFRVYSEIYHKTIQELHSLELTKRS